MFKSLDSRTRQLLQKKASFSVQVVTKSVINTVARGENFVRGRRAFCPHFNGMKQP